MANVTTRKIKPFAAWDDQGTCPTADGRDARYSDNQTNELLDLQREELGTESVETDSGLTEKSCLRAAPLSRGVTQKRCQWFSDPQEAIAADENENVTSSFSLDKCSTAPSSKKIHKRVKLRRRKETTCTIHSVLHENPDPDYSSGHSGSSTAARTVVSLCLPPGCIPSEVIVQVSTKLNFVPLDKECEVDPWINDICAEECPAQPGMLSVPDLSTLTVVHDLKEDTVLENHLLENSVLKMFLQNQRVVYRRNAICEELEMITSFVKINGAKFSLWHLRAELQNTSNCS